jgi:hypothetical protein
MFLYLVDIIDFNTCSTVSPTSSHIQPQHIDPKERRRQRDRERYANMDSNKKEALLKRQREGYHQRMKSSTGKICKTPVKIVHS